MDREELTKMMIRIIIGVWIVIIIASLFVLCSESNASAAEVKLTWDANDPAPEGYRLFMRTEGGNYNYDTPIWQGTDNTCTIDGLLPATKYYFVVQAFVGTDSSGDSNEVDYKPNIPAPINLRIDIEISVYIDVNGQPVIAKQQQTTQ